MNKNDKDIINVREEETMKALTFEPTEEMFRDESGIWRWKPDVINPDTGLSRGGQLVKGAPALNPGGITRSTKRFVKEIREDLAPILLDRILSAAYDPNTSNQELVDIAKTILPYAYSKKATKTEHSGSVEIPMPPSIIIPKEAYDDDEENN